MLIINTPGVTWSPSLLSHSCVSSNLSTNLVHGSSVFQDTAIRHSTHSEILGENTKPEPVRHASLHKKPHVASKKVPVRGPILMCTNVESEFFDAESLNLHEGISERFYIFCDDDCREKYSCYSFEGETKSSAEITDGDEDYQQWKEPDGDEPKGGRAAMPWLLDRCDSFSSFSDAEEDPPDTMDPYLSHKLNIPYSRTRRPRYFKHDVEGGKYTSTTLPRRPRSPVRGILPGKFDLRGVHEEWKRQQRLSETRRSLRDSKDRVSQSIRQLEPDQLEGDRLISSVVLEALLEEVTLTLLDVKIVTDVRTVVNIAVILALAELNLFSGNILSDEQISLFSGLGIFDERGKISDIDKMETGGMRRILLGAYRAPFNRSVSTTLHRRLPWTYMSPAHQRGRTKFYPNVRERIDELEPDVNGEDLSSAYVPDLNCFHLREVLDKSYVAYKRESKYLTRPSGSITLLESLFLRLASFS